MLYLSLESISCKRKFLGCFVDLEKCSMQSTKERIGINDEKERNTRSFG